MEIELWWENATVTVAIVRWRSWRDLFSRNPHSRVTRFSLIVSVTLNPRKHVVVRRRHDGNSVTYEDIDALVSSREQLVLSSCAIRYDYVFRQLQTSSRLHRWRRLVAMVTDAEGVEFSISSRSHCSLSTGHCCVNSFV